MENQFHGNYLSIRKPGKRKKAKTLAVITFVILAILAGVIIKTMLS